MKTARVILPQPVKKSALAFGGQTKNTLCFVSAQHAYISDVHADLTDLRDRRAFEKDAAFFLKNQPRVIACDMHPDYISTGFAFDRAAAKKRRFVAVQHHHAHIVSCMVDNGIGNTDVIGVAFDGTGFGADGSLWGGEFMVCDYRSYKRLAHIAAIPLLGGAQAIRQPWRLAFVWLERALGEKMFRLPSKIVKRTSRQDWEVLCSLRAAGMNTPSATSVGRLFDASASLILDKPCASFEAELARALEVCAQRSRVQPRAYPCGYSTDAHGLLVIDPTNMFAAIVRDINNGKKKEDIALCFHETVAGIIEKVCCRLSRATGVRSVVLSGGVFRMNCCEYAQ